MSVPTTSLKSGTFERNSARFAPTFEKNRAISLQIYPLNESVDNSPFVRTFRDVRSRRARPKTCTLYLKINYNHRCRKELAVAVKTRAASLGWIAVLTRGAFLEPRCVKKNPMNYLRWARGVPCQRAQCYFNPWGYFHIRMGATAQWNVHRRSIVR